MTSSRRATRESLSTRPMIITIALAASLGGFVLPFIGWIAAIALMWLSPVWTTFAKVAVTVIPPLVLAGAWWGAMSGVLSPAAALACALAAAVLPGLMLLAPQTQNPGVVGERTSRG